MKWTGLAFTALCVWTFGQTGFAHRLDYHSDQSLLREMDLRGYMCTKTEDERAKLTLSLTCDSSGYLNIDLYDFRAEKLANLEYELSNRAACNNERDRLLRLTQKGKITRPRPMAFCNSAGFIYKIRVSEDGLNEIEKKDLSNFAACVNEAEEFNRLFNN